MNAAINGLKKLEFEARIFVSFSIVALACLLSYTTSDRLPATLILVGRFLALPDAGMFAAGCLVAALVLCAVSLLRMWAGSVLTAQRVMSFTVQTDQLSTRGPYLLVRNPIYLADFTAVCVFALFLPPPGLLMPLLFSLHYHSIVTYEEASLRKRFGPTFDGYMHVTPRLLPTWRSLRLTRRALSDFSITAEGFRHNALFVLFIPGFLVALHTNEFLSAILIGIPAVLDWAVVHTKLGLKR